MLDLTLSWGDIEGASDELDMAGPFIGARYATGQERAFPRSVEPNGDSGTGDVPDAILDWVVLTAYQLTSDEGPAVISEGAGGVSVTYSLPKLSQIEKRKRRLIEPYKNRVVRIV